MPPQQPRNLRQRFMYQNLLTPLTITPSSVAQARVQQFMKKNRFEQTPGGARGFASGNYTGLNDLQWLVEIYDISAGPAIGQAKFQYSIDGGATLVTDLSTTSVALLLEQGVTFSWDKALFGVDFALGDRWLFKTMVPYGVRGMLEFQEKGRVFRSADGTSVTFDINLGSAQRVRAFAMLDHNLGSTGTIRLQGNSSASWGSSPFDETITWASPSVTLFFDATYRYWRLTLTDSSATYIEVGKLFLGDYLELPHRSAAHLPWDEDTEKNVLESTSNRGVHREELDNKVKVFPLSWRFIPDRDAELLEAMRDAVWDETNKVHVPLIFSPDHREPEAYLCWLDDFEPRLVHPHKWHVTLRLEEVAKK